MCPKTAHEALVLFK